MLQFGYECEVFDAVQVALTKGLNRKKWAEEIANAYPSVASDPLQDFASCLKIISVHMGFLIPNRRVSPPTGHRTLDAHLAVLAEINRRKLLRNSTRGKLTADDTPEGLAQATGYEQEFIERVLVARAVAAEIKGWQIEGDRPEEDPRRLAAASREKLSSYHA